MVAHVQELAREHTSEAIATLVAVMRDPKSSAAARVAASNALLERGYGKPTQPIEADLLRITAAELTDDELAAIAAGGLTKQELQLVRASGADRPDEEPLQAFTSDKPPTQ